MFLAKNRTGSVKIVEPPCFIYIIPFWCKELKKWLEKAMKHLQYYKTSLGLCDYY